MKIITAEEAANMTSPIESEVNKILTEIDSQIRALSALGIKGYEMKHISDNAEIVKRIGVILSNNGYFVLKVGDEGLHIFW